MTRTIVGVLRGGTSNEYNLSLRSGAAMISALPEESYDVRDILIDRSGRWYARGQETTPAHALTQIDVVLNALHGGVGEDGTVQRLLDRAGVPYAGARALPASLALNKARAREVLKGEGIRIPAGAAFSLETDADTGAMARTVFAQFGPPYIVKPTSDGAGSGIRIAQTIRELPEAIADVLDAYGSALVEEYVRGHEVSVGIIDGFRGEDVYALPPAHILRDGLHLERGQHENALLKHQVPSSFTYEQKLSLMDIGKRAHKALGLLHHSRADMILTPRAAYLIEVNANPGLYPSASFPAMLETVGSSVREYLEHLIQLARTYRTA